MSTQTNRISIDTVIVGAGQAGLAISYYLKREGREHVVLEKASAVVNAWRHERWDSFTLVTPNFQVRMPGDEYRGNEPYGFMSLAEVIRYFDDYVQRFALPVRCNVEVFSVEKCDRGYLVSTSEGECEAQNVVIATGLYQSPKIPELSQRIPPEIVQIHSMEYKNPALLPAGSAVWWSGLASPARRSRKSYTNPGGRSISQSAVQGVCLFVIAARTLTIGSPAWACSIRKSRS